MAHIPPWKVGKAVALPLPQSCPMPVLDAQNNTILHRKLHAVELIQIHTGYLSRNYPFDSPEYPVFTKIQHMLRILHTTIQEDNS